MKKKKENVLKVFFPWAGMVNTHNPNTWELNSGGSGLEVHLHLQRELNSKPAKDI